MKKYFLALATTASLLIAPPFAMGSDNAGEHTSGRLVGWDTKRDRLHQIIYLGMPLAPANAFLNDFAIDSYNNAAYIADTAAGENSALIVLDLDTGYSRRVLDGHASMRPEEIPMIVNGREVTLGGEGARIGVNPITIDPSNEWVYYGPMTGRSLYRIRTSHLLDPFLHPDDLVSLVERFGDKPISDGITIDGGGNVYSSRPRGLHMDLLRYRLLQPTSSNPCISKLLTLTQAEPLNSSQPLTVQPIQSLVTRFNIAPGLFL